MSARWAFERFAWGAGRVALHAEPYHGGEAPPLWQGLALAGREWSAARGPLRRLPAAGFALLLSVWLLAAVIGAWQRERDAESDLEIVMFEAPPVAPPLPEPEPILEPEPEPVTEPEPVAEMAKPAPLPKPEVVAARPPAPPPVAKPAPRAPAPKPAPAARPALPEPPRVASVQATPPQPRPAPARPAPAKPVISIDAVAAPAAPAALADAGRSTSPAPRLAPRPEPKRTASARPVPSFDLGAPAAPGVAGDPTLTRVASARAPGSSASRERASARGPARPPAALALPALSAGGAARDPGAEPTPARTAVRASAPAAAATRSRSNDPRLRGVPLGSLASCVSDREEDALKQQLVALVAQPSECVSEAGRYRFVETRNLNAFLLWVERAPSRREADRCVELTYALACVRKRAGLEGEERAQRAAARRRISSREWNRG
jgi:hypothetical protein